MEKRAAVVGTLYKLPHVRPIYQKYIIISRNWTDFLARVVCIYCAATWNSLESDGTPVIVEILICHSDSLKLLYEIDLA